MTNNIPKIRFKGFNNKWEFNILNDLCSLITKQTGFDYSATIKPSLLVEENKESYPFIQNKDFNALNINLHTDFYVPKHIAQLFPKITIDTPSILISISGKIGNVGFYDLNKVAFIGGAVGICKLKKQSNGLIVLYNLLSNNGQKYFASLIKASSHSNITVEDIRKINLYLPSCNSKESEKIGNFFKNIDKLITTNEQKLEKLKNIKTAFLEKMFPQQGETTPKIRFRGFSDSWKQDELLNIADRYDNLRIPIAENKRISGNIPYYGANGIVDYVKGYTHDGEFVLIAEDGANDIKSYPVQYVCGKFWANNHVHVLQGKKNILNNKFLKYLISKTNIQPFLVGGSRAKLNAETMMSIILLLTKDTKEQEKIGNFFRNIDKFIQLTEKKIEKLKNIKTALLEKMFV